MTDDAAQKLTVHELLASGESYRIPEYQRNYAWTATEIRQLIDDVRLAESNRSSYFLGNIVTTPTKDGAFEVVDGQQRLTTLVLLIAALRISRGQKGGLSAESSHALSFASRKTATAAIQRLLTSVTHDEALEALGASTPDDDTDADRTRGAVQGMQVGYSAMRSELGGRSFRSPEDLDRFLAYLLDNVEMIRVVLPEGTDLNRYFEVMNTRGVQLDPTDIVRAKLMSAFSDDQRQIRTFQRIWDACAQTEGFVQIGLTPGDIKLRTDLFGSDWRWLTANSFEELTPHLGGQDPDSGRVPTGSRDLVTALEDYLTTHSTAPKDDDEPSNRQHQSTIRFPFLLLHALALFNEQEARAQERTGSAAKDTANGDENGDLNDKRLIENFDTAFPKNVGGGTSAPNREKVQRFMLHLLRVRNLYDAYIIRRHQPGPVTGEDDGTWVLKTFEADGNGKKPKATYRDTFGTETGTGETDGDQETWRTQRDLVLLESMLRVTYTSPRTMRWITDVLRMALAHHYPHDYPGSTSPDAPAAPHLAKSLQKLLKDFARSRIRSSFWDASRPIHEEVSAQEPTTTSGFDIPRIVFTYLDYLFLDQDFQESSTARHFRPVDSSSFIFRFRNSVEHFAPGHRDTEVDRIRVPEPWKQSLGNLALITVRQNSKFSNASAKMKAESSDTVLRQSPKLWRMAHLTQEPEGWNDEQIRRHYRECLTLLREDLLE